MIKPFKGKFQSILIFGPPGSGKGTVARYLASQGGHFHLSTGDLFRGLSPKTPAGSLFKKYASQGFLVPDDVTVDIWYHYVQGLIATNRYFPEEQFLLLDGIPRTKVQVDLIQDYVDMKKILVLEVAEEVLLERLKRRAKIEGRVDDVDPEVLHRRMDVYVKSTAEVLKCYPKSIIVSINADQRPLEVYRDVLMEMATFLSDNQSVPA